MLEQRERQTTRYRRVQKRAENMTLEEEDALEDKGSYRMCASGIDFAGDN